ncbi:TonB-dependent receptor [Gammaproteobacteria bacterium]|nr:TonB-dependent receptor [Gammaproteobacteria bacterium]
MTKSEKSFAPAKSRNQNKKLPLNLTPLAAGILMATQAPAQEIEEITVTATRRAATVLDIPYNISAFTTDDLKKAGTTKLADLTRLVPGLFSIDQGPAIRGGNNNFSLRGLNAQAGTNNSEFPQFSSPTVSTYIGETPVFFPLTIKDIERVEVLRGPQGTLYGSGSTGGTIRFIPKLPDLEAYTFDASTEVSFTDESDEVNYAFDGVVNIPVIDDRLALRVAAGYEELGGFIDANSLAVTDSLANSPSDLVGRPIPRVPGDLTSGYVLGSEEDTNDYDDRYVRASALWQVTDSAEALLSFHHQESKEDDLHGSNIGFAGGDFDNSVVRYPGSLYDNVVGVPGGVYPNGATTFPANDGDYEHNRLAKAAYEAETDVVSLDVNIELGFATFTSASSYFDLSTKYLRAEAGFYNVTPSPFNINLAYLYGFYPRIIGVDQDTLSKDGFTQEIRLATDWDKSYNYVVGAYYHEEDTNWSLHAEIPGLNEWDQAILGGYGFNPQLPDDVFTVDFDTAFEDIALFGELTYNISDKWQVTGGIRAFRQEFTAQSVQTLPFCGPYCANDGLDLLGTTAVAPIKSDVSDQLFKFNTSYDINDDTMAYFTWAEGFRRGGSNPLPTGGFVASLPDFITYEPDEVTNYEIGVKGRLGERMTYSLAGYNIDWKNFQFDENTPSAQVAVFNGSDARTTGVELEAKGRITEQLRFNFGYNYTDSQVTKDFVIQDCAAFSACTVIIDNIVFNDGDNMPGVPEHSFSGGLDFEQPLKSNGWLLNWHIDTSFRSKAQSTFNESVGEGKIFFEIDSFSIWNASLTLVADKWTAGIYARNLFSEEGITGGSPAALVGAHSQYRYVTRPRTVGLAFTYSYD